MRCDFMNPWISPAILYIAVNFHNGTFCIRSFHFDNGAFILVKLTPISWSLAICTIMIEALSWTVDFSADLLVSSNKRYQKSTMGIPKSFFLRRVVSTSDWLPLLRLYIHVC